MLTMNMPQLLDYLDSILCGAGSTRAEKTAAIEQWFAERAFSVGYPLRTYLRRSEYYAATLAGDEKAAADARLRVSNIPIASLDEIVAMKEEEVERDLEKIREFNAVFITVKYIDGMNRQWTAPWHIQSRTPICIFTGERWEVVSAMPRGPEVSISRCIQYK